MAKIPEKMRWIYDLLLTAAILAMATVLCTLLRRIDDGSGPLIFEISNASIRTRPVSPSHSSTSWTAPIVLPSSLRIRSRSFSSSDFRLSLCYRLSYFCIAFLSVSYFCLCNIPVCVIFLSVLSYIYCIQLQFCL